ncbi:MAG: TolC family protein, partial [Paucimonas sp.]|nr:TolC family protein [Paucimonas sp.]
LLTLPLRNSIGHERFEQAKLQTAIDAVRVASDTRRAYFNAVAANESLRYLTKVKTSAEAGAELAQQMAQVGNFSKLQAARQQVFYADTLAQLARSQREAVAAREHLARLLGVSGKDAEFILPERLPDLPASPAEPNDLEAEALEQRLDVQLARRELDAQARALGLTQATSFINVLEGGYSNRSEAGEARANGYEVSLEIPIFDWSSRPRKAQSLYDAASHRMRETAVRARSEVRESYQAYRTAYDLARHYRDEIVPLRKKISDEVALRYNGMHASVFELLADAREQAASVNAAIEAQRNFWLAETDLHQAVHGSGGSTSTMKSAPAPAGAAEEH